MAEQHPRRIALFCDPGFDVSCMNSLVKESDKCVAISQYNLTSREIPNVDLAMYDIALLDLHWLHFNSVDPLELSDTLFAYLPVILIGSSKEASLAVKSMHSGAQDWLILDNLHEYDLDFAVAHARQSFLQQRALVVNHARYQNVVEDQSELIYRCLPDCTLTFVNKAYADYLGKPVAELEGKSLQDFASPCQFKRYQKRIKSLTPETPTTDYESRIIHSGNVHWQHWSDRAFFDSNGVMLEIQAIGTDITIRRSAEQELADKKHRFETMYMDAPVMMQELDSRGRILSVNKNWLDTLNLQEEDVVGHHAFKFLDRRSIENLDALLCQLENQRSIKSVHCRYQATPFHCIDVTLSARVFAQDQQESNRILIVAHELEAHYDLGCHLPLAAFDMTARQRTTDEVDSMARSMSELAPLE